MQLPRSLLDRGRVGRGAIRVRLPVIVDDDEPRTGTLTERTAGVWRLQATSDPDAVTGETRRISRAFRGTKSEATSALQRFVTECGAGLQAGSVVTVAVLLEQFMTTATVAPTTRQDWQNVVNRHLLPEVDHIALHQLTARDCDHLHRRMALAGLGPSRVRNAHVILHRAVAQAVRWGGSFVTRCRTQHARRCRGLSWTRATLATYAACSFSLAKPIPNWVVGSTLPPRPERDEARSARCDGPTSISIARPFESNGRSRQPSSTGAYRRERLALF